MLDATQLQILFEINFSSHVIHSKVFSYQTIVWQWPNNEKKTASQELNVWKANKMRCSLSV